MLLASFPRPYRFRTSVIGVLLGMGFALYIYRFSVGDANITVLRVAALILVFSLLFSINQSQRKLSSNHWRLLVGIAVLVVLNALWYSSLDAYPIPQREMISHLVNLLLMLCISIWINTERKLLLVLNGYLVGALVAIAIGIYALLFKEIPFEEFLRAHGAASAENIVYLIQDGDFLRLSGPFMDPNFFGIYLLTVVIYSLWVYHFRSRSNFYLMVAVASLLVLPLTISRTAMVGLLVFFILYIAWLAKRMRVLVLLGASFVFLLGILSLFIFHEDFLDRVLNSESAFDRLRFILRGFEAFAAHPFFGSGPASIVDETTGIATAHLMYLSILAKFGLVGAIPYFVFIFYPLWKIVKCERFYLREYRFLIVALYLPLFFMYFLYDFLYFLEFQYLIFAIGYSIMLSPFAKKQQVNAMSREG